MLQIWVRHLLMYDTAYYNVISLRHELGARNGSRRTGSAWFSKRRHHAYLPRLLSTQRLCTLVYQPLRVFMTKRQIKRDLVCTEYDPTGERSWGFTDYIHYEALARGSRSGIYQRS